MTAGRGIRVADWLIRALRAHGVQTVFLLPGGGAMHLDDAVALDGMAYVACHHEQACGIAAEAYSRVTGQTGVAIVTTGPGATNVMTPLAGAWIESVPMMVISGQVKRADMLHGAPLRQRGVQEVDAVKMVDSVTKYAVTVEDPASVRYHFEKAWWLARSGRAGPVWLDIPLDVQAAMVDPDTLAPFTPPAADAAIQPEGSVQKLLDLLTASERPLLLAGHGVRLAGAGEALLRLAERFDMPVVTTWNAADLIPWEHRLCVGRPGAVALRAPNFAVQACDLLVAIGARLDNVVTAFNPRGFARRARRVVVDVDPNELAKHDMPLELAVCADARTFLESALMNSDGIKATHPRWVERCADWKRRYPVLDGQALRYGTRINHYEFVDALSDALPAGTVVSTGSSGLGVEVFYSVFRNKPGQRVFLTSGLGAMGYGLPAAIGACVGADRRPMVAVESDGSLMLNIQELATLGGLRLPICLFVMNNAGYASIRNTQRNYFNSRFIGTGPEANLMLPDFMAVARAFGLPAMRIDDPSRLRESLREALQLPRPCLVDIVLENSETLAPKVAAIPQPDGSMISMPLEDMSPLLSLQQLEAELEGDLVSASRNARAT